jgi:hypothetical protein
MADNRLFIGNIKEGTYACVTKYHDSSWVLPEKEDIGKWIENNSDIDECTTGGRTKLVFFTEYDDLYDWFLQHGTYKH